VNAKLSTQGFFRVSRYAFAVIVAFAACVVTVHPASAGGGPLSGLLPSTSSSPAPGAHPGEKGGTPLDNPNDAIKSLNKTLYIIALGDEQSNDNSASILTLSVAQEFGKYFGGPASPAPGRWAIPQPTWTWDDLVRQCANDPNAVGGVILTYYSGFASHFYLLYQEQTTTFYVFAQVVSCNHYQPNLPSPEVVGIIYETPGANGTPWVVRKSQVSVPLLTLAAVGTALSSEAQNSKATNLSIAAVAGSLFASAGSKDIPGYSDPLRLRVVSQHIGVDLLTSMRALCAESDGQSPGASPDRTHLCQDIGMLKP